ncbi:hypothetical protein ACXIUK_22470 [Vibrio parahaemolyticus]|uniref:hypothetical protein n=1 Tax=Vibrio parahaemolyticus TaxID=670 RepID=UPI001EF88C68|nr:hypothetical protein [Vibrio parahaemolyticus]MCG7792725.1 hypothetical protein [Vibrio parahaemolyticus]
MSVLLVAISGNWNGGNNGQYPLVLEYDSSEVDKPFISSMGWGHGYSGNSFSADGLRKSGILKYYNRTESLWAYEILVSASHKKLDSHETAALLLGKLAGNEPSLSSELRAKLQKNA